MPVEVLAVAEVSPSVSSTIVNERTGQNRGRTVNQLRSALEEGGWVLAPGSPATGLRVVVNIFSMPVKSPEPPGGDADKLPGAAVCAQKPAIEVRAPGDDEPAQVWGWDSGAYKEPPCAHFAYGPSQGTTYESFKAALAAALGMNIESEIFLGDGAVELFFRAPEPGPGGNGTKLGGWASGTAWGGGWALRSGAYRGHYLHLKFFESAGSAGGLNDALGMTVRLFREGVDLTGLAPRDCSLGLSPRWNGSTPAPPYSRVEYAVPPDPNANVGDDSWFRVMVCPYQMAVWLDGANDNVLQGSPFPRSIFISMPQVPDGFTGHRVFAFAANSILANIRPSLEWPAWTWFDDGPWSVNENGRAIIPCLRTRHSGTINSADRLITAQGFVIADNAYVASRKDPEEVGILTSRLAGKLWNCCTLSEAYPVGTIETDMLDAHWFHVSSHAWAADYSTLPSRGVFYGAQAASLWWKTD